MKAFIVGLLFLILMSVISVVCILLLPFLQILGFLISVIFGLVFMVVGIWALGQVLIMLWESLRKKKEMAK